LIAEPEGGPTEVFAAYVIATVAAIGANTWAAAADLVRPGWLLANMVEVGVPRSWLLPLAVLKGAGAAGLLVGLLGVGSLGIAAAVGLVWGRAAGGAKIGHLPDAAAAGLGRAWYVSAIVCPAESGAFVVQSGPCRYTPVRFWGDPRRHGVNEAEADRHH
jgi:hypothetical protein